MTQHANEFTNKAEQLEDAGIQIPKELLSIMLLNSLPKEYENFCIAIESRDALPSMETITSKLIEEEARKNGQLFRKDNSTQEALAATHPKRQESKRSSTTRSQQFSGKCFKCGKTGHKAADCRRKGKFKANTAVTEEVMHTVLNTDSLEYTTHSHDWCLDSGATSHMCNDRTKFTRLDYSVKGQIQTAGDKIITACGRGTVEILVRVKGNLIKLKLQDVMYAPNLRNNLISVSKITERGYKVNFTKVFAYIERRDGSTVLKASKNGQLYTVRSEVPQSCMQSTGKVRSNLMLWHQRLGHLNFVDVRKMKRNELVKGIDLNFELKNINCETCHKAKIHQSPFQSSDSREDQILGLIHSDICGPMSNCSIGGARYFITFIDDKTRYCEAFMLKQRSEALKVFMIYKQRVENETGKRIKKFRSDNGKEYTSKEFQEYLEKEGIKRELTVEYTPQQNGVAERMNRTLVEMARCMLMHSGLPQGLWAEAINTAVFIKNRCPTKALENSTPYEAWTRRKPNVGFLRTFGTKVISLVKGPRRSKFLPKGKEYVMVGYSQESKAYRLWDRDTNKVIKSRDVRFLGETEEPVQSHNESSLFEAPMVQPKIPTLLSEEERDKVDEERKPAEVASEEEECTSEIHGTCMKEKTSAEEEENMEQAYQTDDEEVPISERKRGRPRIIRDGKPGRPRKVRNTDAAKANLADENLFDDPPTVEDAMKRSDRSEWMKAMEGEHASLMENNTWKLVDRPMNKKVLSNKWVFKIKRKQDGSIEKYKARLVARGCEQKEGVDYNETYAPVARYETVRAFLAVCVEEEMHVHQMDVITAYVQGELPDEIYMEQPSHFKVPGSEDKVCLLLKPLYGLKQAGREWHKKLESLLSEIGFHRISSGPCVYKRDINGKKILIIVYVDDLLIGASDLKELIHVKDVLKKSFKMKDLGPASNILGINIERETPTGGMKLTQTKYVEDLLKKFHMENCKTIATPLESGQKAYQSDGTQSPHGTQHRPYRELIGGLVHLANTTRPDIAYIVSFLSQYCADPKPTHWKAAKRVLRYLKGTVNFGISYQRTGLAMQSYVDADWEPDIIERKSYSGILVVLAGGPVSWRAKKQKSVALSTMEAEYMALSEAVKDVIYLRKLLKKMGFSSYVNEPTEIFCDNQGAMHLSKNHVHHDRSKHIDIRYHFTREAQDAGEITVKYKPTDEMTADIFTKSLPRTKHYTCVSDLRLCN